MEMKFSGFQFLFANRPMHIKPDGPYIAFGSRMRSVLMREPPWRDSGVEAAGIGWERAVEGAGALGAC